MELKHIYKSYGDKKVLHDVNISIPEPGVTCIMGPSGCGKSTLALILAGLVIADSGELTGLSGKKTAMVFQEDRLLTWSTACENVRLVIKNSPNADDEAAYRLKEVLLETDDIDKPIPTLSGGMRRRVSIARALASEFDILILDEPFSGLDDDTKTVIMDIIAKYRAHKTILLITHDKAESAYLSDKVYYLY